MELVHVSCGFRIILSFGNYSLKRVSVGGQSNWNEAEDQAESHVLGSVYLRGKGKTREE